MDDMTEARTMGSIATAVLAAVALVLSGGALITSVAPCGGAPARGRCRHAAEAAGSASVAVELTEFAIAPSDLTIAAGGTLEVTNAGAIPHDLAVVDDGDRHRDARTAASPRA